MQPDVERLLRDEPGELVIPAPVTAEVDHLLGTRLGRPARLAFLDDLAPADSPSRRSMRRITRPSPGWNESTLVSTPVSPT